MFTSISCRDAFNTFCVFLIVLVLSNSRINHAQEEKGEAAKREYNSIADLQNAGRNERAAQRWAEFIKKHPSYERLDRVHYNLGLCQLHSKKYAEAATTMRTVLSKFPKYENLASAQYNLAMALYQVASTSEKPEDFKAAAAAFAVLPTKYAQSRHVAKALYLQGESLYSANEKTAAIEAYKKLVSVHGKSELAPDAHYAIGTTQQELGQVDEAVATFQAFLANAEFAKHSLKDEIRLRLAMSLFDAKKFVDADKLFGELTTLDATKLPYVDFAFFRQAQCRIESGKHAEAVALLVQLLDKFKESPYRNAAQVAQGKCFIDLEQFDKAISPLDQTWKANVEQSAEAAYWLGQAYLKLNKPAEALAILEPSAQKYQEGEFAPYLRMSRIDALYELPDRRKETAGLYEAFFKENAEHTLAPQALYMAGLVALGADDYPTARRHADMFLSDPKLAEHPLTPSVMYIAAEGHVLALGSDDKADVNRARQLYENLVAKYPEHERASRSHVRIGWCHFNAKQYDPAVAILSGALNQLKDPTHTAEAYLLIGRCHDAAARLKEAVVAYDAALKTKGDWERADEVLIAAAQSLRKLNDAGAASQRLNELRSKFSNSQYVPLATYQLGEIAQEQNKPDEAIARYNEILQKYADSEYAAPASYGLGAAYFGKEDYDNAIKTLTSLLSKFAESDVAPRGHYLRGLTHQRLKQYAPAVADFQAFLKSEPEGDEAVDAKYSLALCQIGLKQLEPAVQALATVVKDHPTYSHLDKVYYEMAHAQKANNKPADSVASFRALVEKMPESTLAPESWFHIGRFHEESADGKEEANQKKADLVEASKAYTGGLAKAKTPELREKLQYKLGDMLFRQEDFVQSATTLLTQIKEHPEGELLGPGKFLAAESLFRQDKFNEALPLYQQVATAKVKDYNAQALYRAGTCAKNLGDWPVSQKHYAALAQQFPKFELIDEAKYGLGWALQNQRKYPEARDVYQQLMESGSEAAAKARFMLGEIAFEEKKFEDAIELFVSVAASYPYKEWQALARFEAGRCCIELDDKDAAIKQLQIVIDKYPDHEKAKAAAVLIAELKK